MWNIYTCLMLSSIWGMGVSQQVFDLSYMFPNMIFNGLFKMFGFPKGLGQNDFILVIKTPLINKYSQKISRYVGIPHQLYRIYIILLYNTI